MPKQTQLGLILLAPGTLWLIYQLATTPGMAMKLAKILVLSALVVSTYLGVALLVDP